MTASQTTTNRQNSGNERFVHELVESTARTSPHAPALTHGTVTLSYEELFRNASVVAEKLLAAGPHGGIVGISTSRRIDVMVGVLAILRAGKAYLPLDPGMPADRLRQIAADSGIACILAPAEETGIFSVTGLQILNSGLESKAAASPLPQQFSSLAYVLYTSGSTGLPKGVCMGHAALVNLLRWQARDSRAGVGARTLQFAPLSFDVSFQEIFATWSTGGELVLIDDDLRLDPERLLGFLGEEKINRLFVPFVALQYLTEAAAASGRFPASLAEVMTAGEQLKITPQVVKFFTALPGCTLFNQYGPTECHVVTSLRLGGDPAVWPPLPSIGKPITQVRILLLDEEGRSLAAGETGELCIGGVCVADGYLNRPELTAEKFVVHEGERIYRTGDLARYLPDGNIEFLGRRDLQVKIRGYRVEPGEIEVLLNDQPGVRQAVVVAREDVPGQKRLVAYMQASGGVENTDALRRALRDALPDYMMPSAFVWMKEFPKTTSGKVDRKSLPRPEVKRPDLATLYRAPSADVEKKLAGLWASLLQLDRVGADDNFFELGGNSLLAVRTIASMKQDHGLSIPVTRLYEFPTVAGLAAWLGGAKTELRGRPGKQAGDKRGGDIAVIGMAGRFPGAASVEALWDVLKEGRETIRFFSREEIDASVPREVVNDPDYVAARGVIDGAENFDAAFFNINPRMAALMDPQQRIFLEIVWEVLEKTGYVPARYPGSIGVFAGTHNNSYYPNNVTAHRDLVERVGTFQVMTLNEKDYIATRTAYELNLHGPAVSVHSACSTSLLAIAEAVESLRSGQCDVALAGGVAITAPIASGHIYQEGAMLSRDGHCRSFDASATGTVFSDGAAVVLLKPLAQAVADGDAIHGVIRGVGVNNDGGGKGSFTAPSARGQAGAIRMAIDDAAIDPATITCIEAHGTGTPVGDPIEIEGLTLAFGEQRAKQYCAIGSVKSNMGHLTAASGATGLIKMLLALRNKKWLPSIGFDRPNPNIDFSATPFFVNTVFRDWPAEGPRRAGVSSFGVGGTNVHIVLEEFNAPAAAERPSQGHQLFVWSAKTAASRERYASHLARYLRTHPRADLADAAWTLQTARAPFAHRRFAIAADGAELAEKLESPAFMPSEARQLDQAGAPVVFMFPGQGSQSVYMGHELYRNQPAFRSAVDECALILRDIMGEDIRDVLFPVSPSPAAEERINNTHYTQPAMFVIEYALARLWMSWGVKPAAFVGHSIGEYVGAHLAGVFSLADGLRLIAARGRMMAGLPRGSMLSVRAPFGRIEDKLPSGISLAAENAPNLCVVAGPTDAIRAFAASLEGQGIAAKILQTSHAFHSEMMEPAVAPFEALVRSMPLNIPRIPVMSTVTASWLTDAEAVNPAYWSQHLRRPVRFGNAVAALLDEGFRVMLETGPRGVTSTLVRQQPAARSAAAIPSLDVLTGETEGYAILKALGQLWLQGIEPDWRAVHGASRRRVEDLPTYAFEPTRFWVAPAAALPDKMINLQAPPTNPGLSVPVGEVLVDTTAVHDMRKEVLISKLKEILEDASGIDMEGVTPATGFIEMGLDSLLLTQVSLTFKKEFGVPVTFRQLNEQYTNLDSLAGYLDTQLPADKFQPAPQGSRPAAVPPQPVAIGMPNAADAMSLITQQIQLLSQQVALLGGQAVSAPPQQANPPASAGMPKRDVFADASISAEEITELKKPFGATARIEKKASELSAKQQAFLENFTAKYNAKTRSSKQYTQENRAQMADPRVVTGFKPQTKEIVYPLVVNHSRGAYLRDIDGNEYIDVLNGFGSNLLGYQNEAIREALKAQIDKGFELGPQHELAGEVCRLICRFTGADRSALCNTGSEAVLGAMRIARTVTGRSLIVAFSGSYHGIVDEVIVRGTKKLKSFPAAPGIMPEAVQNMLILDYGTPESLQIIRDRAHELAAVLVEPVQSRRPEFQPVDFLRQLREITEASGTTLIFDEVITGFRMHPGGTQGMWGIKADIGTYGKVIAGGMPIGVIAGKKQFMDALDGGFWQFGDSSTPEAGVTYFAGTFVRHPLALAASKATLEIMQEKGPALQQELTALTRQLADRLNEVCELYGIPLYAAQFGSLFKIKFKEDIPYGELIFALLREKGIHIWDGFPCFLTAAHTTQEVDRIVAKFAEAVDELVQAEFLPASPAKAKKTPVAEAVAPVPGARLGRDKEGNPAWFIADPNRPGKYMQVD